VEQLAAARGITPEQLAAAVERPSLKGDRALSAVQNWMRNNDHPRCKAEDCRKIAAALGATLPEIVKFTSAVFNSRGSARKAKLVVDMIRGKQVDAAMNMLTFTTKKAAVNVKKCLAAALADAESFEADVSKLYVLESTCDDGMQIKRFQPKDRGRAHPIIKRSSNIVVSVGTKGPKKGK
jgi:large subunit ribosomal protein L22